MTSPSEWRRPSSFVPVAARRAVSSCVLGGGAGGRYRPHRPRRCGSGASLHSRLRLRRRSGVVSRRPGRSSAPPHALLPERLLRRRSWRGVCLRVRGPTAAARSARWPARVVAVEPLLDQASDKLPQRHARVHVREQPPELLQPLLALRVDSRLQLVAAVAERAHPVGRRRQLRVHVGQHLADLPGALAGGLLDQLAADPPHPAPAAAAAARRGATVRPARSLPPVRSVPPTPPPTPPVRSPRCRRSTRGAAAGRTPTAAPRRRSASASRRATPPARPVDRRTAAWRRCAERRPRRCSRARAPRSRTGWRSLAADTGRAPRSRPGGR